MVNLIEKALIWFAIAVMLLIAAGIAVQFIPGASQRLQAFSGRFADRTEQMGVDDAEQALDAGDKTKALQIAAQVVAAQHGDAAVDNQAASLAQRAGDDRAAERYYQLAESADAQNPWNFVALGEIYARQKRYLAADAQLRAALSIVPQAPFLHYDLGVVELQEHLTEAALADFTAELKRSPSYEPARQGRDEAIALLGRSPKSERVALAVLKPKKPAAPLPLAAVAIPSPTPTASPAPTATPAPSPSAEPTPSPSAVAASIARQKAALALALKAKRAAALRHQHSLLEPTHMAKAMVPLNTPEPLADLAAEAKSYLLGVGSDIGFAGGVPSADPTLATTALQAKIDRAKSTPGTDISALLDAGSAALRSGRLSIAYSAFTAATAKAESDWRGPYYSGLTAQAGGNYGSARDFYNEAIARGAGPQAYVSLAIADLATGYDSDALANAQHAAQADPTYEAGRFTAGMIALILADVPVADRNLSAAVDIGGAPERTQYFLSELRRRESNAALRQ